MRKPFYKFGIQVSELALLLLLPDRTVYSWLDRNTSIPLAYNDYFIGITKYEHQHQEINFQEVYTNWERTKCFTWVSNKEPELRKLNIDLRKNELDLHKLLQRRDILLRRLHFAQEYPNFLSTTLQAKENLKDWCSLVYRRSALDLGALQTKIQKLSARKVSLDAQIQYWEGINA